MEAEALYVRDGDGFVGTILTQGGWHPEQANGGTVLALLGQCLDDVPSIVPMSLTRFTADLVRPVPLGRRLHVVPTVLREGKKIQVVQLQLLAGDVEHVRATALRLRDADVSSPDLPPSTTDTRPAAGLTPPEASLSFREVHREADRPLPGFLRAVEMRHAERRDGSGVGVWLRLEVPVVSGEPVRPTALLTFAFDYGNLIGVGDHSQTITMINPDVSAHVLRAPVGDWVAITGDTRFNPALGRGVSSATLSDREGVFALATISQLLQRR
jgi:hypothetical protein